MVILCAASTIIVPQEDSFVHRLTYFEPPDYPVVFFNKQTHLQKINEGALLILVLVLFVELIDNYNVQRQQNRYAKR